MHQFLQQLINGLSVGATYALIALGYTMVYGILKFINFAHSDIFALGVWMSITIAGWLGVFYPPAVLLMVLIVFVFVACLYVSVVISRQRRQIERLIEEVAIIAARQRELDRRVGEKLEE